MLLPFVCRQSSTNSLLFPLPGEFGLSGGKQAQLTCAAMWEAKHRPESKPSAAMWEAKHLLESKPSAAPPRCWWSTFLWRWGSMLSMLVPNFSASYSFCLHLQNAGIRLVPPRSFYMMLGSHSTSMATSYPWIYLSISIYTYNVCIDGIDPRASQVLGRALPLNHNPSPSLRHSR